MALSLLGKGEGKPLPRVWVGTCKRSARPTRLCKLLRALRKEMFLLRKEMLLEMLSPEDAIYRASGSVLPAVWGASAGPRRTRVLRCPYLEALVSFEELAGAEKERRSVRLDASKDCVTFIAEALKSAAPEAPACPVLCDELRSWCDMLGLDALKHASAREYHGKESSVV